MCLKSVGFPPRKKRNSIAGRKLAGGGGALARLSQQDITGGLAGV